MQVLLSVEGDRFRFHFSVFDVDLVNNTVYLNKDLEVQLKSISIYLYQGELVHKPEYSALLGEEQI